MLVRAWYSNQCQDQHFGKLVGRCVACRISIRAQVPELAGGRLPRRLQTIFSCLLCVLLSWLGHKRTQQPQYVGVLDHQRSFGPYTSLV